MAPWREHVEKVFDPEVVLEGSREVFTEGEWHGREGAVAFVANQMDVLKGMWLRLDEVVELDDNRLIAAITFGGQARHTEIPVELSPVHLFELREGKVVSWRVFRTREEAFEAAGHTPRDDIETVKRVYELAAENWAGGRAGRTEWADNPIWDLFDSQVVIEENANFPDADTYRGREGLARWWGAFFEIYDDIEMSPQELTPVGDRVLVRIRQRLRSKMGVETEHEVAHVFTLRDGKVVHLTGYSDMSDARAALGLTHT